MNEFPHPDELDYVEGYENQIRKVLKRLSKNSRFLTLISTYRNLSKHAKDEDLQLKKWEDIDSDFVLQNTTFLSQSKELASKAKSSSNEIKPILYFYAEEFLYAFFIQSFFEYKNTKYHHGLRMNWNQKSLIVMKDGLFPRILDVYCLLCPRKFKFSPFVQNNSTIEPNDDEYSVYKNPELKFTQMIEIKKEFPPLALGLEKDLTDYLLLFYSSSSARYRPVLWNNISKKSSDMRFIDQAFERYDLFRTRLKMQISSIANEHTNLDSLGGFLGSSDLEIKETIKNYNL